VSTVLPLSATTSRWGARVLSSAILLFWGFFLVAHLVGDEGRSSRPLAWNDYFILATLGLSLAGLALAWKWELAGSLVTLAAVGACAAVNWRVLIFPGTLIPIAAVLYLASWWICRASSAARRPAG
jgi:hypothetical protein